MSPDNRGEPRTGGFVLRVALLWAQGSYYLLAGAWPLVSIETFLMVTGPKTDHLQSPTQSLWDHWLVMTAGVLITALGAALLTAAWRRSASAEAIVLAIGAAVGLTAIDVTYVSRRVIEPVYLLDAAAEVVFLAGWLVAIAIGHLRRN